MSGKKDALADAEIARQVEILASLGRRRVHIEEECGVVRCEVDAINYRLSHALELHSSRVRAVRDELDECRKQNEDMTYKLSMVDKVAARIVEFYLRTQDRTSTILGYTTSLRDKLDFSVAFGNADELARAELLKENSLLVLDKCSANLCSLAKFRSDFRDKLHAHVERQSGAAVSELEILKDKVTQLERQKALLREEERRVRESGEVAIASMRETTRESSMTMRRLQKQNEKLMDEIKRAEDVISELHERLDERERVLRQRDIQKHKANELDSLRNETLHKHRYERNKIESEIYQTGVGLKRKISHLDVLRKDIRGLDSESLHLDEKIRALRKTASRERVLRLVEEEKAILAELRVLENEKRIVVAKFRKYEVQIRHLRSDNARTNRDMASVQAKLTLLARRRHRKKLMASANVIQATGFASALSDEEFLSNREAWVDQSEYFKRKLTERDDEIKSLKSKIAKLANFTQAVGKRSTGRLLPFLTPPQRRRTRDSRGRLRPRTATARARDLSDLSPAQRHKLKYFETMIGELKLQQEQLQARLVETEEEAERWRRLQEGRMIGREQIGPAPASAAPPAAAVGPEG